MRGLLLRKNLIFIIIFVLILSLADFVFSNQGTIETTIKISICGNNIIDEGEVCDGTNLTGKTCQDFGYTQGNLACSPACDAFNVSGCYTPPAAPPPAGGGVYIPPTLKPPKPTPKPPKPTLPTCDFNGDDLCNFIDLSILLYWFGKTGPEITPYDLNGDKKINFVDVSILLYRWKDV